MNIIANTVLKMNGLVGNRIINSRVLVLIQFRGNLGPSKNT
jgi:hypothetical protein